jgi:hypothetical protein
MFLNYADNLRRKDRFQLRQGEVLSRLALWIEVMYVTRNKVTQPSPEGDRKGLHPTLHHSRPYKDYAGLMSRTVSL